MTKVGNEKVWNESTNNGVIKVFSIGVDELFSSNVFSMSKVGSPSCIVFDVRKSADGFDVDLDYAKFAFLVG